MKNLFKDPFFYSSLAAVVILGLIISSYVLGWTTAPPNPPSGNLSAPLNEGSNKQSKTGYLAIGTSTSPSFPLDIAGVLRVGSFSSAPTGAAGALYYNTATNKFQGYTNSGWSDLGGGSELWTASGTSIYYNSGNVGIGITAPQTALDVNGAIKVGTQDTCNASTVGAIRYNSTNKHFEGCNGNDWSFIASIKCDSSITFTYKGVSVTYGIVEHNGLCWMDRNLGASQVATAYNDSNAYGDLFQWGRGSDGHQNRNSGTTTTLSSSDNPGHSYFIEAPNSPYDWRSPQNNYLWQGVGGINNPCPSGWRVPTSSEWDTERNTWASQTYYGAFSSPLKLTAGGNRDYQYATFNNVGVIGYYWSSTINGYRATYLNIGSASAGNNPYYRAYGLSVRCVQN